MKTNFWITPRIPTRFFDAEIDALDFASRDVNRLTGDSCVRETFTADDVERGAEWVRPKDLRAKFGIGRATAYSLWREGKIRGVLLRRNGKATGMRLISAQSVRDYILSQIGDNNGARTRDYYAKLGREGARKKKEKAEQLNADSNYPKNSARA